MREISILPAAAGRKGKLLTLLALFLTALLTWAPARAQSTATLTGTVSDIKGAVIPGATITVTNAATRDVRGVKTDKDGLFAVPNLLPATYSVTVSSAGFAPRELTHIDLHAGDTVKLPEFKLAVGAVTASVTVESASNQMLETVNGQRSELLSYQDIQDIPLEGRDTSELLKVLPGVSTITSGNVATFNPLNVTAGQSAIGQGLNTNGAPNRGGTTLLLDGVNIIDPGADFSSLVTVNPEMTQEVNVLSTNFGADTPFGPIVISAVSKGGSAVYHGEGYFDVRNDVLNANDWADNHTNTPKGGAAYYYPGGNISGFVPHTNKRLLFFGGTEFLRQNLGNSTNIVAYVPTPEMLGGNFSTDNANNLALCPFGFYSNSQNNSTQPGWCQNIAPTTGTGAANPYRTIFPDGSTATAATSGVPLKGGSTLLQGQGDSAGGYLPPQLINPNMIALSKLWPRATYTDAASIAAAGGYNYKVIPKVENNGWIYRLRADYNFSDKMKFYATYQQGHSSQLANGRACNVYFSPNGCLPFPGGGLVMTTYSKVVSGHLLYIFNATTTNEFVASWVYGSIPTGPPNPSADYRTTNGVNIAQIYGVSPNNPTYAAGTFGYPGIVAPDQFGTAGAYVVRKEIPAFADNVTKVFGNHTLKFGAYASNTDNYQGNMSTNTQGSLGIGTGYGYNYFANKGTCGTTCGTFTGQYGTYNQSAAFLLGNLSNYTESNKSPNQDLAYQTVAFYVNDTWKASSKLNFELGLRFEHIGHWYDRQGNGLAVFFPSRVLPDFYSGKVNPGYYWHGIDAGVPLSGQPDRIAFVSPRFGMSYDVFGNGKTLVRGGFGAYRFAEQYNDVSNALATAQAVTNFSASTALTTGYNFLVSQIGQLAPVTGVPEAQTYSSQYGFDISDYGVPLTYSYNLTIDQKLPWNMLLDIAYVGNNTKNLSDTGASLTTGGQLTFSYANQNKTPIGAFFKPDPFTGVTSCNPEILNAATCSSKNTAADYRPYGKAPDAKLIYGTAGVYQTEHVAYANYNAVQAALVKRAGPVTLNFNATYSKALATINNYNPFYLRANYGFDTGNRPFIFNSSYTYRSGNYYHGNRILQGAINGWTISGISLYQKGAYAAPGINIQYDPATVTAGSAGVPAGTTQSIGGATYFGTDAGITIQPNVTCNPTAGLAYHQVYQPCYTAPPVGTPGGIALPYVPGPAYLENDLALYKSFTLHHENKLQVRISAFNWLNHPLPTFSANGRTTQYYYVNYQTRAISPNTVQGANSTSVPANFGILDYKSAAPGQRIMELNIKYNF